MEGLTASQKYFYLYLITNPSVNQLGLYAISLQRIAFETGLQIEDVEKHFKFFEEKGKVVRSSTTLEFVITRFWAHNKSTSPKLVTHVKDIIKTVKDKSLLRFIHDIEELIDVNSIPKSANQPAPTPTPTTNITTTDTSANAIPTLEEVLGEAEMRAINKEHAEFWYNEMEAKQPEPWTIVRGEKLYPVTNWRKKMFQDCGSGGWVSREFNSKSKNSPSSDAQIEEFAQSTARQLAQYKQNKLGVTV